MPMDIEKLKELGIRNVFGVFGRGARGETLARGCHMGHILQDVKVLGIRTIIDLRTADHNDKLERRCGSVGLDYYHIPIDSKGVDAIELRKRLDCLFRLLDGDGFYISCQQGLHRTDIALALYFFYHDDREIPQMAGHRTKGFLRCDDIMRRINAMRCFFPDTSEAMFEERRSRFLSFNRNFQ